MTAIPWAAILNVLLQIVLFVIEKQKDKENLREKFLDFIARIEKDTSVKLKDEYQEMLRKAKERQSSINNMVK